MKQMTAESGRKRDFIQNSQNCWEGRKTRLQAKVSEIQHLTHNRLGLVESKANVVVVSPLVATGNLAAATLWCLSTPRTPPWIQWETSLPLHDWKFNILAATCPGQNESSHAGGQFPFAAHRLHGPCACVLAGGKSGNLS